MFWSPTGGVRRVLNNKRQRLPALGWRHTILAPGAQGEGYLNSGGLPLPSAGGLRWVLRREPAVRLIEQAQPDIVEAADPFTLAWAVLSATARLGVPAVAFCHSDLPAMATRLVGGENGQATRRGRFSGAQARDYLTRLYQHFDLVMAPSLGMANRLREWGVHHAVHQPLGVDTVVFSPGAADPAWRARQCIRWGIAPGTRLLVYTGRFAPEKNLQLLADAVQILGPGWILLCIGAGPTPPVGDGVRLLAPEYDSARLARLVASADAYVHAGDQETFGLGVLEAMACGTPVVASASGGLGELANGVATTVAHQDAGEWAQAIRSSVSNNDLRMPQLALQRARGHDWTCVMNQLSLRYRRLLHGRPEHAQGQHPRGQHPQGHDLQTHVGIDLGLRQNPSVEEATGA